MNPDPFSHLGEMLIAWAVGMLALAVMMPMYWFVHKVQAKFHTYKPLKRNWHMHFTSGFLCATLSFVAWFCVNPRPLTRLAAMIDVVHFFTTLFQMRILMFGDRDIVWPEYFWLTVTKSVLACRLFVNPVDAWANLTYGLILSSLSYQRLFIFAFQYIFNGDAKYTLATTFCGVVGGFGAVGVFWGSTTLLATMALYSFVLKGQSWVGGDMQVGGTVVKDKDRAVKLFRQPSMRKKCTAINNKYHASAVMHMDESIVSLCNEEEEEASTHARVSRKAEQRLEMVLQIIALLGSGHCEEEGDQTRVYADGVSRILERFGFGQGEIDVILSDMGIDPSDTEAFVDMVAVRASRNFAELCDENDAEYTEVLLEKAETGVSKRPKSPIGNRVHVSKSELASHNAEKDMWISVDGKVYDVTAFKDNHPGGPDVFIKTAGTDVTAEFNAIRSHTSRAGMVDDMMKKLQVGILV